MKKLIVNADDFGFNREVTDGILECFQKGAVTSTTLMVNMPDAGRAFKLAKENPQLSVGIHLNLSLGKPISHPEQIPCLVDGQGNFRDHISVFSKANRMQLAAREIEKELEAQILLFLDHGIKPSHSDSHHHTASCVQTFPIQAKLLKKYGINKIRTQRGWYHTDTNCATLYNRIRTLKINTSRFPQRLYYEFQHLYYRMNSFKCPNERFGFAKLISNKPLIWDIDSWKRFIDNMPNLICEFCTHPGLLSSDPNDRPEFRRQRFEEYRLFSNPESRKICDTQNIELINFNQL